MPGTGEILFEKRQLLDKMQCLLLVKYFSQLIKAPVLR